MTKMRFAIVVGARPNLVKLAPLVRAFASYPQVQLLIIHTGQHYDYEMSQLFFEGLDIPAADYNLGVGSGGHGEQTGRILIALEPVLRKTTPQLVIVVGDVNSTLAGALTAVKLHIPVAHVEAGLRSFDRTMPEEINRLLTDAISDFLFTPHEIGDQNLLHEGIPEEKIHLVGDIMIDCLLMNMPKIDASDALSRMRLEKGRFALLTLHRPSNVDDPATLRHVMHVVGEISERIEVLFPVHPRTNNALRGYGILPELSRWKKLRLVKPLGYLDFMHLMKNAQLVLTDSGGIQEETTFLNVPCITIRPNTERPFTISEGTNVLVGNDPEAIKREAFMILEGKRKHARRIELWDGRTAERIARILTSSLGGK
jgi:UDP-N-acetylglucosamine 2-epimerase (non-hydrolysing)